MEYADHLQIEKRNKLDNLEMASTHGIGRNRTVVTAPDKGSFPLDHFHECEEHAVRYNACLDKH